MKCVDTIISKVCFSSKIQVFEPILEWDQIVDQYQREYNYRRTWDKLLGHFSEMLKKILKLRRLNDLKSPSMFRFHDAMNAILALQNQRLKETKQAYWKSGEES